MNMNMNTATTMKVITTVWTSSMAMAATIMVTIVAERMERRKDMNELKRMTSMMTLERGIITTATITRGMRIRMYTMVITRQSIPCIMAIIVSDHIACIMMCTMSWAVMDFMGPMGYIMVCIMMEVDMAVAMAEAAAAMAVMVQGIVATALEEVKVVVVMAVVDTEVAGMEAAVGMEVVKEVVLKKVVVAMVEGKWMAVVMVG